MPAAGGIGCLPSLSVHSTGPRGTAWCGVHLQIVRLHGRVGHTADDAGRNFRTTPTQRWSIGGKLWSPVKPYCFCPTQASDRRIGRMQSEQSDVVEPFGVHPPTTCVHGLPHTWSRSMVSGGRSEPVEYGSEHGLHHAGGSASRDAGHATRLRGDVQKKNGGHHPCMIMVPWTKRCYPFWIRHFKSTDRTVPWTHPRFYNLRTPPCRHRWRIPTLPWPPFIDPKGRNKTTLCSINTFSVHPKRMDRDANLIGTNHWQNNEQEKNLLYIAVTRARQTLTFLMHHTTQHVPSALLPSDIIRCSGHLQ